MRARTIIRSFRWVDAQGREAWKHRWNTGDKFSWSQDQAGTQSGKGECCPSLYNLESLTDASDIIMVEGERDVETINQLLICSGLISMRATCTPNGAQSVKPEYLTALHDKAKVWISGDNDAAGTAYRDKLAMQLYGKAGELFDLSVPQGFNDWTDWAESGDRTETFRDLVLSTRTMPAPLSPGARPLKCLITPRQKWNGRYKEFFPVEAWSC